VTAPAGVSDPTGGNNSATDTDTLTPEADLSLVKSDGKDSVVPGTNTTYTISVTNNGPSTISGAQVSDVLPAGTTFVSATNGATYDPGTNTVSFTTGTLITGGTTSFDLAIAIAPGSTGTLSNTATVAPPAGVTDSNSGNDSATDTDNLTPRADLAIAKTDNATSAVPGTNVTYTITVTNNGPSTVTGATVSDVLPAGTAFVSATGGATYDGATNTVTFTTGTVAPSGTTSFDLTLAIAPGSTGHAVEHRDGDTAPRRDGPDPGQRQLHRHGHTDAAGRPVDHQDRWQGRRRAGDEHDVHDHGDQQWPQHCHRRRRQRRLAHGRHLRVGHGRRHL